MKIYLNDIGGLGNRMFIYSFFLSIKKKYDCEITLFPKKETSYENDELYLMNQDRSFFEKRADKDDPFIHQRSFLERVIFFIAKRTKYKKASSYYELEKSIQPFLNKMGSIRVTDGYIPIDIDLNKSLFCTGYFQSEKYWKDVKEEVKKAFYKPELISDNKGLLGLISNKESVCIHVRLGDYVDNAATKQKHYVCTPEYYFKAIEEAKKKIDDPVFVVFTNDVKQAKEIFADYPEFVYSEKENSAVVDLQLMIQCKHFIISNSTFSWWAQYLSENKNKMVFAPCRWFNDGTVTDLYDDKWNIINI